MFQVTFIRVLVLLTYMVPGYLVCRMKKASAEHLPTLSAVLIYICSPCMIIVSFLKIEFTVENIKSMALFFAVTFVLQALFMLAMYFILRRKYHISRYRILTMTSVLGNVGFFGIPVIRALLPDSPEAVSYASVYIVSMNILIFTVGVYCLTRNRRFMTVKAAVLNPTVLSFLAAILLGAVGVGNRMPSVISDTMELLSQMTTPLSMFILGIRLASMSLKKVLFTPFLYLTCLTKLILFPLLSYLCVCFLPLALPFKAGILILSGAPCASITLGLAELYHGDSDTAANSIVLTTLASLITLPLLSLLIR